MLAVQEGEAARPNNNADGHTPDTDNPSINMPDASADDGTRSTRPPPPPPPPLRRSRSDSRSSPSPTTAPPNPPKVSRPPLRPAPSPPELRTPSPAVANPLAHPPPPIPAPSSPPRLLSPIPIHSPNGVLPNHVPPRPPSPPPRPFVLSNPPAPKRPRSALKSKIPSPPRTTSPPPQALGSSPVEIDAIMPTPTPPLPPARIDVPKGGNSFTEGGQLQGIPYPSDEMFLDSEGLSTLEKIFLFARSDAAYHRLFVARTLPEWIPDVDPHEAVEYILPLLNGLGTDPEESVREAFAPSLSRLMWYFFTVCDLTEDEQPSTPSTQNEHDGEISGAPLIPVQSFTPLLGSLLLSVNRVVAEAARWDVVELLMKMKDEEEAELVEQTGDPDPIKGDAGKQREKEKELQRQSNMHEWTDGRVGPGKRELIRREIVLGVVLGMARLEDEENEDADGLPDGEGERVGHVTDAQGQLNALNVAAQREMRTQKGVSSEPDENGAEEMSYSESVEETLEDLGEQDMDVVGDEDDLPPAPPPVPMQHPLPGPEMHPDWFPSPPAFAPTPPPQRGNPTTPSLSPPEWLPVPASPSTPHQVPNPRPSPLALIASLALMSTIASAIALPPPTLEAHFLPELVRIAAEGGEWVRREAGFVVGALAKVVSPQFVKRDLVPLLLKFSRDSTWHVRHSTLFSLPALLGRLEADERRDLALRTLIPACSDASRAVRSACLEIAGEAIVAFKDDPGGPPAQLIELFLGDPSERLEDGEESSEQSTPYEWINAPGLGLKPVRISKRDADRCLVCAFNFPAVALTLGPERWNELREYYAYLARDRSVKVRKTLAASVGALAGIVGEDAARRDLVAVWRGAFTPVDGWVDEEIAGLALDALEGMLRAIGGDWAGHVVRWLEEWWTGAMGRRWRLREQVARRLAMIAQQRGSVQGVAHGVRRLLARALSDEVAAVREAAAEGVPGVCRALKDVPALDGVRDEVLQLGGHPSFRYRMAFVACVQALLADDMHDELARLWTKVWALGQDPVVDVRIAISRVVGAACGLDSFFRFPSARPAALTELIHRLTHDRSSQVRSFVRFLRDTQTLPTPLASPARGVSVMSPSAKFSRPPHPSENEDDDEEVDMDIDTEFYPTLDFTAAPAVRAPPLPPAPPDGGIESVEPEDEGEGEQDDAELEEEEEEEEDPEDPFADFVSRRHSAFSSPQFEEDQPG